MTFFFRPVIALMHRLKYPQKFLLISLLFILPLGLVLSQFLSVINGKIDFTRKEIDGNTYLRPLRQLLELALLHQLFTQDYLNGNTGLQAALEQNQLQIEARL